MAANTIRTDVVSINDLPAVASLADVPGPDYQQQIDAQMRGMERMAPAERVAAMHARGLRVAGPFRVKPAMLTPALKEPL